MANKWWDGYQGQKFVLLDDIDPDSAKPLQRHLKIWLDRYPFIAEAKGGACSPDYAIFYITSQYSIEECFPDERTQQAIRRRCRVIHQLPPILELRDDPAELTHEYDRGLEVLNRGVVVAHEEKEERRREPEADD